MLSNILQLIQTLPNSLHFLKDEFMKGLKKKLLILIEPKIIA